MNELEIIQHSRVPGLTIFFNTVDYRTPHFHPEWELIWLLDNPLQVSCGGSTFRAVPNDLLLFMPSQPHEFRQISGSCTFLCLQVSPELMKPESSLIVESNRLNDSLSPKDQSRLRGYLLTIMDAYLYPKAHNGLFCLGQMCMLFHDLLTHVPVRTISDEEKAGTEKRNKRLSALIRFVDENYMHKIRLSDFAEAEGVSMSYLSHFVKSTLNQSFQDYVNSVRVNCACKLIAAGEERLTQISLESGFSDYRYFSGAFKKQFGMTPEQYRFSHQKPENAVIHHSIHSQEQFYTDEQSREILTGLQP